MKKLTYKEVMGKAENISLEIFMLFASVFILTMFLYISLCRDDFMWFSRSGSIVVLLAAWMQARNYDIQQKLHFTSQESLSKVGSYHKLSWKLPKQRKIIEWITLLVLVLGTLVWGFGDLLG